MDVNDKVHESARESFCDEKGCQSGMYFEYEPFSTVYFLQHRATVHKPRDSSELSHGHIAVTGSPACSVRKFDPKLPKRPKLSARNVVRLTATNCALLPRLQPADHLRPFLPFKRHELQTISNHFKPFNSLRWKPMGPRLPAECSSRHPGGKLEKTTQVCWKDSNISDQQWYT